MKPSSFLGTAFTRPCLPCTNTMTHAMMSTTPVRSAVPRLDSTPVMPTLPRIEVRCRKNGQNRTPPTIQPFSSFWTPSLFLDHQERAGSDQHNADALVKVTLSPSSSAASKIVMTVLLLSMGTTLSIGPRCKA